MNELEKLGIKYGTDKIGKHHYLPVYYEMFKDRRNEVKKVLEIGVGEGAGLRMFQDFFPNAQIYGLDNELKRCIVEDRITVIYGKQEEAEDLAGAIYIFGSDIDLVVDDGSHKPKDQVSTALTLVPLLDKGTIYIIEDVADPSIQFKFPINWNCEMVEVGKRYDDRLIIIKK